MDKGKKGKIINKIELKIKICGDKMNLIWERIFINNKPVNYTLIEIINCSVLPGHHREPLFNSKQKTVFNF